MNKTICIEENNIFGYAGEIWNSAYYLSGLILSEMAKKLVRNKIVLEIGSGTGICGLFVALSGAKKVFLTDREIYLDLLKNNFNLNKETIDLQGCEICVTPLDWNYPPHFKNIKDKIDLIIASDIIYHGVNYKNILSLFEYFSTVSHPEMLLAYTDRGNSSAIEFFQYLKEQKCWGFKKLNLSSLRNDENNVFESELEYSSIYSIKYLPKCN